MHRLTARKASMVPASPVHSQSIDFKCDRFGFLPVGDRSGNFGSDRDLQHNRKARRSTHSIAILCSKNCKSRKLYRLSGLSMDCLAHGAFGPGRGCASPTGLRRNFVPQIVHQVKIGSPTGIGQAAPIDSMIDRIRSGKSRALQYLRA